MKTYLMIIGIAFCITFISTSCGKYSDNEQYFIDNYDKELDIYSIIDTTSYRFIPLETTIESVFISITKAIIDSNRIFILDNSSARKALIFSMDGSYVSNVGQQGHGPGEYTSLRDMDIDRENKQVILYESGNRKLMFYDYSGNFIREVKMKSYPGLTFSSLKPDRLAFFLSVPDKSSSMKNQLLIYSDKGDLVDSYVRNIRNDFRFGNPNYFCRSENDIYFIPMFYDKIYMVGEDLNVKQIFDLEMDNIMVKDKDLKNSDTGELFKQSIIRPFDDIVISRVNRLFCCWTTFKGESVSIFGDLNTKKIIVGRYIWGDIKMPVRAYGVYKDYFVGSYFPIEYKKNRFPEATINDNQGILLFKFHDLNKYQ